MRALGALAAALAGSAAIAAEIPRFPEGTTYAEARAGLVADGWKPERSVTRCPPGMNECRLYPETLSCSDWGLKRCAFRWRKSGTKIEVDTIETTERVVDRIRCRAGCRARPLRP